MTDLLILAGSCGEGRGSYDTGVFHMPDGTLRGVEDLTELDVPCEAGAAPRRRGIARGLREALAAGGPLPRPLDLAASAVGIGLDLLGGEPGRTIALRFADGATATIRTEAACVTRIAADREVVRLAVLRRAAREVPPAPAHPALQDRVQPDARALATIFTYEKRGGRLRRLAAKALDETGPSNPNAT